MGRKKKPSGRKIAPLRRMKGGQVTLYAEINAAIEAMGTQVLEIAVYDEQYLHPLLLVITQNIQEPGHMANIVIQAKTVDKRGRPRKAMNAGPAEKLLIQWTSNAVNLLQGLTRDEMAELCGMTRYDVRLDWYCKTITNVCRRVLHLEVGWYQGRFRVLTARQVRAKETMLVRRNVTGGAKRAEDRLGVQTGARYKPTATVQVQAFLFEDAEAAELTAVRDASD